MLLFRYVGTFSRSNVYGGDVIGKTNSFNKTVSPSLFSMYFYPIFISRWSCTQCFRFGLMTLMMILLFIFIHGRSDALISNQSMDWRVLWWEIGRMESAFDMNVLRYISFFSSFFSILFVNDGQPASRRCFHTRYKSTQRPCTRHLLHIELDHADTGTTAARLMPSIVTRPLRGC